MTDLEITVKRLEQKVADLTAIIESRLSVKVDLTMEDFVRAHLNKDQETIRRFWAQQEARERERRTASGL